MTLYHVNTFFILMYIISSAHFCKKILIGFSFTVNIFLAHFLKYSIAWFASYYYFWSLDFFSPCKKRINARAKKENVIFTFFRLLTQLHISTVSKDTCWNIFFCNFFYDLVMLSRENKFESFLSYTKSMIASKVQYYLYHITTISNHSLGYYTEQRPVNNICQLTSKKCSQKIYLT